MSISTMVVVWLIFGGITAGIYNYKNLKIWEGFLIGVLLGPLGVLIGLCSRRGLPPAPPGMLAVICPRCNAVQNIVAGTPYYSCWQCHSQEWAPAALAQQQRQP